jgi:hypothetical protein
VWWLWHVAAVGSCIGHPSIGLVAWSSHPTSSKWWGSGLVDVHGYWLVVHTSRCVSGIVLGSALLGSLGPPLVVVLVLCPLLVEVAESPEGTTLESSVWSWKALLCLMLASSPLLEEVLKELQ